MGGVVVIGALQLAYFRANPERLFHGIPGFALTALVAVPVVYSALTHGFFGAVSIAVVGTALVDVNIFAAASTKHNIVLWTNLLLLAVLDVNGTAVAFVVERTEAAKLEAEAANLIAESAEAKFRSLFDQSRSPILLLDGSAILEGNRAAAELFAGEEGGTAVEFQGRDLPRLLAIHCPQGGPSEALSLLVESSDWEGDHTKVVTGLEIGGSVFRVILSRPEGGTLAGMTQLIFSDVTEAVSKERRAKEYASYVLQAQEAERKRISKELHDIPVQSLIHLLRELDALALSAEGAASGTENMAEAIKATRASAAEAVEELREIAQGLRPAILDDLGLVSSLSRLVSQTMNRTNGAMDIGLEVDGDERRLDTGTEVAVYRIAQESLSNIIRHSKASTVRIRVAFGPSSMTMKITDNGRGIGETVLEQSLSSSSLGLIGMFERAKLIGADLDIGPTEPYGTEVNLALNY